MKKENIIKEINKKKQEIEELERELEEQTDNSKWLDVSDVIPNCEVD